jgi:hypothetical protein
MTKQNDPNEKEMLKFLSDVEYLTQRYAKNTPEDHEMFDAIRRLIIAVGEWQKELKEITDAFVAGEVSQSLFEAYLTERARAIRDFGEEGK